MYIITIILLYIIPIYADILNKTRKFHSLTAIFLRLLAALWRNSRTKAMRTKLNTTQITVKLTKSTQSGGFLVSISLNQYYLDASGRF